jgi:hypothetical protein
MAMARDDDMKAATGIIALGGACAACCAVPLAAPLLAGLLTGSSLFAFGTQAAAWMAGLAALGLAAFLGWRYFRAARASPRVASCGCATSSQVAPPGQLESAPIACTLTQGDFTQRVQWIQNLARDSLIDVRRDALALHLHYEAAAAAHVREMVQKEQACCGFLRFDLREDSRGVHLTITAPEQAREAATELFRHFAPELARFAPELARSPKHSSSPREQSIA